jgi:hypothetical protein
MEICDFIVISRAPPGRCDLWERYRGCYPRLISGIPPGWCFFLARGNPISMPAIKFLERAAKIR